MMKLWMIVLAVSLSPTAFASDPAPAKAVGGWEALSALQTGNMRFYEGHPQHPNLTISRREEVAGGQHPHTIVLSCSDSRVPPEEIFDQGLGDIFTVRNAGNVMTTEAIASIEYAIEHLGARLLIVMGHESCGAVGAAIASVPGTSSGSPSLDVLVKKVRDGISSSSVAAAAGDKTFRLSVKENVNANLREIVQKSAIVRTAIAAKGLVVGQAIYSLKSGRVEFWDVGRAVEGTAPVEKTLIKEEHVDEQVISPDPMLQKPKAKMKAKAKVKAAPAAVVAKPEPAAPSPEAAAHESPAAPAHDDHAAPAHH